jgi:hypothetical protein
MDPILSAFDRRFSELHRSSADLIRKIANERLFVDPREKSEGMISLSVGTCVLRSAARVEQTFGGIATRLWDDPFEWTLPEALATTEKVLEYLDEVEATRLSGFGHIRSDADLVREIPAPERLTPLIEILLTALADAERLQGQAFAIFPLVASEKPPVRD